MTGQVSIAGKRVALRNVGCKLNLCELEALQTNFDRCGCKIVPFETGADIYVINTCTVTAAGDADSRKAVRRARRANPQAAVVATGCYAQRQPEALHSCGADLVVGNGQKAELLSLLAAHLDGLPSAPRSTPRSGSFVQLDGAVEGGRTRGAVQIQDGCDEHCTYCVIPSVRGRSVSRPQDEILEQARRMVGAGYRELNLTGVHSGSYGKAWSKPDALVELLLELEKIDGLERLRLNSIEPTDLTAALIDFAAGSSKLCRHFHLPLQSGDDGILKRMGRRYSRTDYAAQVTKLAVRIPECAIGADVMVGFPGEGESQFASTCSLLTDLPLTYLHVFPFSPRPGTPAARMQDRQTSQTKKARVHQLIELNRRKRLTFHQRFVGRTLEVLVEQQRNQAAAGLTDNYIKVLFPAAAELTNRLLPVRIVQAQADRTFGELAG